LDRLDAAQVSSTDDRDRDECHLFTIQERENSLMDIAGKNVVVTGGASGIGKGMCERFASMGAAVVVSDVNAEGADAVAGSIGGTAITCDVTDSASVDTLVAGSIAELGHIDVFFANAGIGVGGGLSADARMWELSMGINALGPAYAARAVVPHLAEHNGAFVITASVAGLVTGPVSFNYAVSKHAAVGVAEWLAINHGHQIHVAAICPTVVDTPMIENFGGALMQPLTVDAVVDAVVEGLAAESFLILPGEGGDQMLNAKLADYDGFLANLNQRVTGSAG